MRRSRSPHTTNKAAMAKCTHVFPLLFTSKMASVSSTRCSRKSGVGGNLVVVTTAAAAVVFAFAAASVVEEAAGAAAAGSCAQPTRANTSDRKNDPNRRRFMTGKLQNPTKTLVNPFASSGSAFARYLAQSHRNHDHPDREDRFDRVD